ncbi:MAG TPA: hypothetical protein VLG37_01435 [Candidatus Saccharimonadales bacterium]|nr:hypothetical protein [Candidatus Saccharimonadales bacterium]
MADELDPKPEDFSATWRKIGHDLRSTQGAIDLATYIHDERYKYSLEERQAAGRTIAAQTWHIDELKGELTEAQRLGAEHFHAHEAEYVELAITAMEAAGITYNPGADRAQPAA